MKLRVKIKHLVYLGFVLFALMPLYANWLAPAWELKRFEEGYFEGDWAENKERILNAIESAPNQQRRLQLIERIIIVPDFGDLPNYAVQVTAMSQGYNSARPQISIRDSEEYLWEYIQNAPYAFSTNAAAKTLSRHYAANGDFARIKQLYRLLEKKAEQDEAQSIFLKELEGFLWLEVEELLYQGKYALAYERLEKVIEEYKQRIGEHNQQIELFEQHGKGQLKQIYWEYLNSEPNFLQFMRNKFRVALVEGEKNFPVLRGKAVRSDGQPVQEIGVILRKEDEGILKGQRHSVITWSSSRIDIPYFTQTAEDGSFVFYGLTPGKYSFSYGASLEQVDGWFLPIEQNDWVEVNYGSKLEAKLIFRPLIELEKPVNQEVVSGESIRFVWQPVEEATTYTLQLGMQMDGGSISQVWRMNIPQPYLEVPIEELYQVYFLMGTGVEDNRYNPSGLLAFANPEATFVWSVLAYNDQGKQIAQSDGYRLHETTIGNLPFFSVQARELNLADQLLLEQEYAEAYQAYEKAYAANPNDLHSLRLLARLVDLPLSFTDREESLIQVSEGEKEKYLLSLAEKESSTRNIDSLVYYYYKQEKWSKYDHWFQKYKELRLQQNMNVPDYTQALYICALIKQNKLAEAENELKHIESEEELFRVIEGELTPNQQELVHEMWLNFAEDRKDK